MYAARRERVLKAMAGGVALFPSAAVFPRNNDVEHAYRQDSDLFYLTGFDEPESLLLLVDKGGTRQTVLFVRDRDPEREAWDGSRAGPDGAKSQTGVDAAFPIEELDERLPEYLGNVRRMYYRLGQHRDLDDLVLDTIDGLRKKSRFGISAPSEIVDSGSIVHEMRLRKDAAEIDTMRAATTITRAAHEGAMRLATPGRYEYEIEAELLRCFRAGGSRREAYEPIVGSGPNATILHYRRNDRRMEDGDLLLIDAGCELDYYASDVTRTFPVNGRFTAAQRAVYQVVLAAQKAAIEAVRPGATIPSIHEVAVARLIEGMIALGWFRGRPDDVLKDESYRRYYLHRTSHWLGMDVHDVGFYTVEGRQRPLEPGFVLTIEPGLYVSTSADVSSEYRGIGIRIEDDIVVTENGYENLSAAIPKEIDDIEALMRGSG